MCNVNLKIDCSRIRSGEVDDLARRLRLYFQSVFVAGGDLIFASGNIGSHDYNNAWRVINGYDVTVI